MPGEVGPQQDMAMSDAVPLVFGRGMDMNRELGMDRDMDRDMSRDQGIDRAMSRGMDVDRGISLSHAISRGMPIQPDPSPPQPQLSVLPLRSVHLMEKSCRTIFSKTGQSSKGGASY